MWFNSLKHSIEKRETAKWLPLIQHWALWKCVILVKEKASWKYGLLWGWIEKHEWKKQALKRELKEEIGADYYIKKLKSLVTIETTKQIHNIYALIIWWKFSPSLDEISWFAFYPLEEKYLKEREAMEENMENYAIKAMNEFRHNHDRKSYEVSEPKIDWKYFDQFHRELDELMQQIVNKNKN